MLPLILPMGALLMGVALLLLGSGLLNTLLAIRGGLEGYSDSSMGMIMSGYFVGFLVGTFVGLPIIRRIGHIRTFAFCAAIGASSVLLHVLIVHPWAWMLLRVITGMALVILYTVIESWLNGYTQPDQRGKVFSIYMAVNLGALAAAQQLLRLDSATGFTLFGISAILVTLSLLPITWTRLAQPEVSQISKVKYGDLYRAAPVAMAGALLSGLAMGAFWGLGALYARRIGLDTNSVATFISAAVIGGAILQFPMGRYSDSHDRRRVLAVICLAAALGASLLSVLSHAGHWVMLAIALYGGMAFAVYPVCVAHLSDHLDADSMLAGTSGILLVHGVGAALGPALAGQIMGLIGPQALPVYFVIIQLLLAIYALSRVRKQEEELTEHHAHFVPMVRTTPTAFEMLPDEEIVDEEPKGEGAAH